MSFIQDWLGIDELKVYCWGLNKQIDDLKASNEAHSEHIAKMSTIILQLQNGEKLKKKPDRKPKKKA